MGLIPGNLQDVKARIGAACRKAGRDPDSVRLLAVSKTWPASCVREAAAAGQRAFGENYVQEGVEKVALLTGMGLEWHFIGPVQSNKTRLIAESFDWVHSIDRLRIAERLSEQRGSDRVPLDVCLQVNVSGEDTKSGCAPGDALGLARAIARLPNLRLRGLMAIPQPADDEAAQRAPFRQLRELFDQLVAAGLKLDTLSIGMSHDLDAAIAEGSTMVRVGTAIFGARTAREEGKA